jgi:AraC-like DNA-binding protein
VVSFMPEFVYSLGSPSHDYAFLLPFYSKQGNRPHVVVAASRDAGPVFLSLARLLECYFNEEERQFYQAGCKVFLLELLYHLARRVGASEVLRWEFLREQQRSLRLKPLFDHISRSYADKLTVAQAASLAGMSQAQLMKIFKRAAGMTLITYINHVRLANAARLLKESARSVADVASEVGFADQSYFDKQFKRAFGCSPTQFRTAL